MTVLTPNEKLTGTPAQKRDILDRLTCYRADPRHTLRLAERYPHLTFTTMDQVVADLSGADADVFAAGRELARDRFAELGQADPLPLNRVFMAIASDTGGHGGFHDRLLPYRADDDTQAPGYRYVQAAAVISLYGDRTDTTPSAPGMVGIDLVHAYVHDCFHYLTFRSYRLGTTGVHRNQHGINFRRESGNTYSARDPQGSASTRNLGIIMEGAFDVDATTITRTAAVNVGITCPTEGIDHFAFLDAVGEPQAAPQEMSLPNISRRSGYSPREPRGSYLWSSASSARNLRSASSNGIMKPLSSEAVSLQRRRALVGGELREEKRDLVFAQSNGRPISARDDWDDWKAICKSAGVRDARVHDSRHPPP